MSSQYKVKRVNDCIVSALFIASYALTMITTQHKR